MAKAVHPSKDWRWGVKVWRTKEIRDLISPHSQRCMVVSQFIKKLVAKLTRLPYRLASTTAKLKSKKLVGLEANEVKHVI